MALIPDEAIDRLTELSKGARHLYVFLARCRNQRSGLCCPSVTTTQEALGANRATVYALRKELSEKKWAQFEGDKATFLLGFNSPIIQTANVVPIGVKAGSPIIQTDDANSPTFQTPSPIIQTDSPEIQTKQSRNLDSYIRNNQQIEPANITNNSAAPSASRTEAKTDDEKKRQDDPFYQTFSEFYKTAYDCPYLYKKADFVQLAACKKQGGDWLTLDQWRQGLANYFASPIGAHTLADLCSRFGTFYRGTLDRFGKPVDPIKPKHNGNGNGHKYETVTWETMSEEQRAKFRN